MDDQTAATRLAPLAPLDRDSYEPAYVQLVNVLSHAIATGQYRAGDQLPTEAELCAAYDVSPMTVRRAIGVLLDRGAVSTTRGRGTFVKPLQLAAATFELERLPRPAGRPARRGQSAGGARRAGGHARRGQSGRPGGDAHHQHPAAAGARRRASHVPPRVARLRPDDAHRRVRARRHRPARSLRGRRRGRPQARRAHHPRLGPDRGRGAPRGPAAPAAPRWSSSTSSTTTTTRR